MDEFKASLTAEVLKYLMLEYPHFITKKFVQKLTKLIHCVMSIIVARRNNAANGVGRDRPHVPLGQREQQVAAQREWFIPGGGVRFDENQVKIEK